MHMTWLIFVKPPRLLARLVRRASYDLLAAVSHERVPDDEAGSLRTEPENRVSDFLGLTHSSDRLLRDHLCPAFRRPAGEPAHHWRVDVAWAHRIDANVLRGIVERGRARESDHAVLRRSVSRAAFDPNDPCSRRRVHDRTTAAFQDQRDLVLHAQKHSPKIDIDDPVPLILVVIRRRSGLLRLEAGIVERKVEAPESLARLLHCRL